MKISTHSGKLYHDFIGLFILSEKLEVCGVIQTDFSPQKITGGQSSVHKLPRVSILFCILRTIYKLCLKILIQFLKRRDQWANKYRNRFHLRKLGFVAFYFFCVTWPFYSVLRLVVCSVLFSYLKRSKAGYWLLSQITNLSLIKEPARAPIQHESAKSLRPGESRISLLLIMGIAMLVFFCV